MECAVRPAVLGDCPAITRLNREELGYDYPQEKTFAKLQACLANPAHAVFVAERGGEVVGYLHLEEYDVLYAGHMVNVLGIARIPRPRPQVKRTGHRRLQRLPPPGGGEGPPRRRGSLGPLPGRGGNAPCLRRIQEGRPRLLRKPGVYGQQAPAELQKEPHPRGAVTASLFSPGNNRNPRGFYEENVKNQKF